MTNVKFFTTKNFQTYQTIIEIEVDWVEVSCEPSVIDALNGNTSSVALAMTTNKRKKNFGIVLSDELMSLYVKHPEEFCKKTFYEIQNLAENSDMPPSVQNDFLDKVKYHMALTLAGEKAFVDTKAPLSVSDSSSFSNLSHRLPAIEQSIEFPCKCESVRNSSGPLRSVIIHLNDTDRWTREKIADWLDELHDSGRVNIEFPVPDEGVKK